MFFLSFITLNRLLFFTILHPPSYTINECLDEINDVASCNYTSTYLVCKYESRMHDVVNYQTEAYQLKCTRLQEYSLFSKDDKICGVTCARVHSDGRVKTERVFYIRRVT